MMIRLFSMLAMLPSMAVGDPMLAPDLTPSDTAVILEVLAPDATQQPIVRDLLHAYAAAQLQDERVTAEALDELARTDLHAAWIPRDFAEQHRAWTSVRAASAEARNPTEARAIVASNEAWARDELRSLLKSLPVADASARTILLDAWSQRRQDRLDGLAADIQVVLDAESATRWPLVTQAIRRQRPRFSAVLDGEHLDLARVLRDAVGDDVCAEPEIDVLLDSYAADWSEAALARDRGMMHLEPRRRDAQERGDHLTMVRLITEESQIRQALVDVNWRWYEAFTAALAPELINTFQRAVNRAWYPDIFESSQPDRMVAWWLSQDDLPDDQRRALVASRVRFGGPRLQAAAAEREARRRSSSRRLTAKAEQRAMAEVFGPTALFRLSDDEADQALNNAATRARQRRELDMAWSRHLHELMGAQAWAAVPDHIRKSSRSVRRGQLGEDGKPLRFGPVPTEATP